MPDDCDCDYCRKERGQVPLRRAPSYGRNVHRPVSAERLAEGEEYVRQCLVAIEAKIVGYKNDALHQLAKAAVDKGVTLAEFERSAGAAYESAQAYCALQKLSIPQLEYINLLEIRGGAWHELAGHEQEGIDRYLDLRRMAKVAVREDISREEKKDD